MRMKVLQVVGAGRYVVAVAWVLARWLQARGLAAVLVVAPAHSESLRRTLGSSTRIAWPSLVIDCDVGNANAEAVIAHAVSVDGVVVLAGDGAPVDEVVQSLIRVIATSACVVSVGYPVSEGTGIHVDDDTISAHEVVTSLHRDHGVDACLSARVGIPARSKLAREVQDFLECIDV